MSSLFSIATSGLNNAVQRIANATNNIVNASSTSKLPSSANAAYTGFQPQDVVSLSVAGGGNGLGVTSALQPRNPAYYAAPDAQSPNANADGLVAEPNVDLNADLIASKEAQVSYGANAKLVKVGEELDKTLLDAIS